MMVDDGFYAEDGSYEEYDDYAEDGDAAVSQTAGPARMESYAAWTQDSEGSL